MSLREDAAYVEGQGGERVDPAYLRVEGGERVEVWVLSVEAARCVRGGCVSTSKKNEERGCVQGYLAHEKTPNLLGPPWLGPWAQAYGRVLGP